jgi:uncharacterized membrane protein
MEARAKILGHAIHPILIVFPLGLLATSVVFDIVYIFTADPTFGTVSYWMLAAGIIGGLIAAPFGLIDWMKIPRGTRAKTIGLMHAGSNVAALILFALSWWMRSDMPQRPTGAEFIVSLLGAGLALMGGWFGGELVERLGVGVDEGANLDAPNSLTHAETQPIRIEARKT